jgi:SAM-dependent methyltransferase
LTEDSTGQVRAHGVTAIPEDYGCLYDEAYYRTGCGPVPYDRSEPQWPVIFGRIADTLIRSLNPGKVLDAGCALGFLVESLRDRSVEAWGIDISPFAIANVRRDMKAFCRVGSLAEPLDDHYDLITCIEVLEHMPEADAIQAVRNLTGATDMLLFSSTPFDIEEPTHFNVKPTLGWLKLFAEHGFAPDLTFDAGFVAPHAMLLRRQAAPSCEVLRLFSECIRWRHIAVQNDNRGNILQAEVAAGQTRVAAEVAAGQTRVAVEVAAGQTRVAELQAALAREREYVSTLSTLQEQLMREAQEIHAQLRDQAGTGRQEFQEMEAGLRREIARVDRRTAELDRIVQGLAGGVEGILQSRIWRTLVSAGGIMLRLTGRKA